MIDLQDLAYKCTCPVKRQPCKHSLSLLLQYADPLINIPTQSPPEEVKIWIEKRDKKALPKSKEALEKTAANKVQNKSDRLHLMRSGIEELRLRILDLVHNGITQLYDNPILIDEFAARMVDAKLGGIGKQIRLLKVSMQHDDWTSNWLHAISQWQIAIKMSDKFDSLSDGLQADLLQFLGYHHKKDDLNMLPIESDIWIVLGALVTDEGERIKSRKTYLKSSKGNSITMLMEFVFGNNPFEIILNVGNIIEAEVIYFPSSFPFRITIRSFKILDKKSAFVTGFSNLELLCTDFIDKSLKSPLLHSFGYILNDVYIRNENEKFVIIDSQDRKLEISLAAKDAWVGVSISAIQAISIFGIWNGQQFEIISYLTESKILQLNNKL